MEYRRREHRDVWHFHSKCHWWPQTIGVVVRSVKPKSGEFCNECMAKNKREKQWVQISRRGKR